MGKIIISSNVTLDGVVQDPDGEEGFELGGWFHQFVGVKDLEDWVARETEEALGAEALLLGRRSSEWFAYRMLSRDDASIAPDARQSALPEFVGIERQAVTDLSRVDQVQWLLAADLVEETQASSQHDRENHQPQFIG